jgi:hypothetical protein
MKTVVNRDIKMSKKMMEALSLFEAYCVIHKIQETTEYEVKEFIKKHYDKNISDKFEANYLY